ncbi:hypothetical protein NL676_031256 [Syzygium grande]|nr:hypothetical protein NL676_031256 [Syzygium grande]
MVLTKSPKTTIASRRARGALRSPTQLRRTRALFGPPGPEMMESVGAPGLNRSSPRPEDRSKIRLRALSFRPFGGAAAGIPISESGAGGSRFRDWFLQFMSSSLDLLAPSLETVETTKEIIVPVEASPFEITTGEKRKREGGRVRSRVWQHFTKLEKRPGEREECSYPKDDLDDGDNVTPLRVHTGHSMRNFSEQEASENFASKLVQLKEENTKLLHERDDLAAQKTTLEQLIVTMAAETARLMEENTKLKEECTKLQEEKQKTVTREDFARLETQINGTSAPPHLPISRRHRHFHHHVSEHVAISSSVVSSRAWILVDCLQFSAAPILVFYLLPSLWNGKHRRPGHELT